MKSIPINPFQGLINIQLEPKKAYYLGGCPDHDNLLSGFINQALPSTTSASTSKPSVQEWSYAEAVSNFPLPSQPKHTRRPSSGQATHTCTAQTQTAANRPTYASMARQQPVPLMIKSYLHITEQQKNMVSILQNTSVPTCVISINQ